MVVFAVLVLPFLHLQDAYSVLFRAMGNAFFGSYSSVARVEFKPYETDDEERDVLVVFTHRASGTEFALPGSSKSQGYIPTAFIIALTLASPLVWRRRLIALAFNLVAVTAFVALRQLVFIASVIYHPDPVPKKMLDFAYWVLVESFPGLFMIPLAIWVLITFRRRDLERLLRRSDDCTAA